MRDDGKMVCDIPSDDMQEYLPTAETTPNADAEPSQFQGLRGHKCFFRYT